MRISPKAEIGFSVGSTLGSNGATLVYFPGRYGPSVFPRVDVRAINLPFADQLSFTQIQAANYTFPSIESDGSTQIVLPYTNPIPIAHDPHTLNENALPEEAIHIGDIISSIPTEPVETTQPTAPVPSN